jgi:hypothetical protein
MTITHELVHSSQGETDKKTVSEFFRQLALDECGASFITNEIIKTNIPKILPLANQVASKHEGGRINTFETILRKYGENTYDVYFNNVPDDPEQKESYEDLKRNIYSEFNSKNLVEIGILKDSLVAAFERAL